MGQYYCIVNVDKQEFIDPHEFGDGLKLMEFGHGKSGTLLGLTALLRQTNGSGGGDIHSTDPIIGSWAGNRITIVGDYDESRLFQTAYGEYKDVSHEIIAALKEAGEWNR